jgi:N-acetylglucosaminyldiphosphoundecaprenol N-acetyl-beta-D-mannosaminyltransferase
MYLLGIRVDNLNTEEVLQKIEGFLKEGGKHHIVTVNPEFLVRAKKVGEFAEILNNSSLSVPDGIGLVLASRIFGNPLKARVAGVDLMERLCEKLADKDVVVYLYGARVGVAESAADNLKQNYGANLRVLPENFDLDQIKSDKPGILFVALGSPKQEQWIVDNLPKLKGIKVAVGVGGAFDFIGGRVRRAPRIFQKVGLEWCWRLVRQPWRFKRVYKAVVVFSWLIIKEKFEI